MRVGGEAAVLAAKGPELRPDEVENIKQALLDKFCRTSGPEKAARQMQIAERLLSLSAAWLIDDRAILLALADLESGFRAQAKNPGSSAYGVFQVIDATWRALGLSMSMRSDLEAQLAAGVALYRQYLNHLKANGLENLRGAQRAVEIYTLHHDGPSGADCGGREIAERQLLRRFENYMQILTAGQSAQTCPH